MVQAEYHAVVITGNEPTVDPGEDGSYKIGAGETGFDEFWNDTYLMWETLYRFGWKDDNIHVLFGDGADWSVDNPRYDVTENYEFTSIVDDSAYIDDIDDIFNELENEMTSDDILFVYTFDHGALDDGHAILCVMPEQYGWCDSLYDSTFADWVDDITLDKRIFYMQQCFSGGFINDLSGTDTYILTATDDENAA
jgi:hypothetical protein